MAGPPPIPFFRSPTVKLVELNGTMRVVVNNQIKLAIAPWRLVEVSSGPTGLVLRGAFPDLEGHPNMRVIDGIAPDDAAVAVDALAARYGLPKPLETVASAEVEKNPRAYHDRYIEVAGIWETGWRVNRFHGARLSTQIPHDTGPATTKRRLTVRGIWRFDDSGYPRRGGSDTDFVMVEAFSEG